MSGFEILPAVLSVGSTILGVVGQQQQAAAQEQMLNYRANALRMQAAAEQGLASSEAAQDERRKQLAIEHEQALAAASGAGAQDPTVLNVEGNIAKQGELTLLTRLAQGQQRAQDLQTQAAGDTTEAADISAEEPVREFGTILNGATSWFGKYGRSAFGGLGGPSSTPFSTSGGGYTAGYAAAGGVAPGMS